MKKHLLLTAIVLALVLCFSCGIFAADIVQNPTAEDANQYVVKDAIVQSIDTADLYIGTVADWKANGSTNFPYVAGRTTFFENGEAIHNNDIIITNGEVGVVLAVGTRNPWGYPAGSILDAGTVGSKIAGQANRDTTWSIETLINDWDAWGPANCGVVTFDLVKYDFTAKKEVTTGGLDAVKVSRVYDIDGVKFDVVSYYGIAKGENFVYAYDCLKNTSGKVQESNATDWSIGNAFCITNKGDDGGAMFDMYATRNYPVVGSYGESSATGAKYSTTVVVPDNQNTGHEINSYYGAVGYKGIYSFYDWAVDETRTYSKYVVLSDNPGLNDTMDFILKNDGTATTKVTGKINNAEAAIVVYQGSKVYAWYTPNADGTFEFAVPKDDGNTYTYSIECDGMAPTGAASIDNTGDTCALGNDLRVGEAKDALKIVLKDKKGNPVWGKVEFLGEYPTVRYTGNSIYQAKEKGVINAYVNDIEDFDATVFGQGYYFYSNTVSIDETDVENGVATVEIDMKYGLQDGWLAADLHHHANKNDAFADPEDAIPSMLASGLDVAFLSDHDFTVNNAKGLKIATEAGMAGFLPSEEISCSWAHFNVIAQNSESYDYFLDNNKENHVISAFAPFKTIVEDTHAAGANITANHPWYSYGLFYTNDKDAVPGGYTDDYDTIEINSCCKDSENFKAFRDAMNLWTAYVTGEEDDVYGEVNKAHYLVGGSDTHDVLYPGVANNKGHTSVYTYATGKIRTVAKADTVKGDLKTTALNYANAVADGNSYVTLGPVFELDKVPGEYYNTDKFELNVKIDSLTELQDIVILSSWGEDTYTYEGLGKKASSSEPQTVKNVYDVINVTDVNSYDLKVSIDIPKGEAGWVAVMAVDEQQYHMFAVTNPYWVANTFPDVDMDAWYFNAILAVQQYGVIEGYPDGTFRPEGDITRAEFAAIMYRLMDGEKADKASSFTDVSDKHWAKEAIDYLAAKGIVNGYPDGTFRPDAKITRAEIAQIFYNAFGWSEFVKHFDDVQPGVWYYDAVTALATVGIVNGYPDNSFLPNNNARRCEVAQIIYNLIDGIVIEQ